MARELPAGQAVSLDALGHAAGPALVAARANLAILRRGQTEQYFQARQAAQDAVAGYGEAVRVAGAALASEVVDNVYRTVGLLVAVGIAALLQPNASLWLVRIAALLYTAYVFFVREFFVRSRAERHTLDRAAFERRVATMRELGASERATLAASADDSDAYFTRYLARARGIYLALIVAGAVLSALLLTPLAGALSPGTHPAGHASPPPTATLQR